MYDFNSQLTKEEREFFPELFKEVVSLNGIQKMYYLCDGCYGNDYRIWRSDTGTCFKCRQTNNVSNPFIVDIFDSFGIRKDWMAQEIYSMMTMFMPRDGIKIPYGQTVSPYQDGRSIPVEKSFDEYKIGLSS